MDQRPRALAFNLAELGGGLGDLGVLVPLATALILTNGFNATAVLLVFGVAYIGSGLYYRLPVPVQPLKAMAAIAIAQGLSPDVISTAGLIMGFILLGLAASGAMVPLASLFSKPIVRGIQAAVGVLLAQAGLRLIMKPELVRGGEALHFNVLGGALPAGVIVVVALGAVLLLGLRWKRVPLTLVLLIPAIAAGALFGGASRVADISLGPQVPAIGLPDVSLFWTAFVLLVVPQLPLTLGNAVVACEDTAHAYFGDDAARVTQRSLLTTKGLANVFAGLIGGMPVCHGSGGLTAHHAFGARTGGATVMLGAALIALALAVGSSAASLLGIIPPAALGLMLGIVGVQHALLVRDTKPGLEWLVVALVVVVAFLTANVALGFGAGIVCYHGSALARRLLGPRHPPEQLSKLGADGTETQGHLALPAYSSDR